MSFINKIALNLKEELKPTKFDIQASSGTTGAVSDYFSTKVKTGSNWYPFGEFDNGPEYFEELAENSAIHGAILKTKAAMISGEGLLINGAENLEESAIKRNTLTPQQKAELKYIEENKLGGIELQNLYDSLAANYALTGAFAYLITWNKDFTKIASYKKVDIKNLRAVYIKGETKIKSYYYSDNGFYKANIKDFKEYFIYDQKDREHFEQIVYERDGFGSVYGTPSYKGGFDWILIDIELGVFHKSNIKNGLNPGLHFKFYTEPESQEEKNFINKQIANTWMGALKTGRFVSTFSKNKELATDVVPIETSGLDKQLVNLTELSDRKIISAHQLTTPLLAGVSTAGQLGGETQLTTGFILWNNLIIKKMRQRIDVSLQKHIFDINLKGVEIKINPFDPISELIENQNKNI